MTGESLKSNDRTPFQFVAEPQTFVAPLADDDLLVRVPIGVSRKQSLFQCFASAVRLPGYFGWNWDAFRECLLDLSWLDPAPRHIVIVHDDLPFVAGQRDLAIYLSVLDEIANGQSPPQIQVVFPEHQAETVRRLWRDRA